MEYILKILILFAAAAAITAKIFCGSRYETGPFSSLFLLLWVQYLLHLAFACVIILICILTGGSAVTMAGVCACIAIEKGMRYKTLYILEEAWK